jgi:hypothetical protein
MKENNFNQDKKIETLGIHIQKKTKIQNKKQDYNFKTITLLHKDNKEEKNSSYLNIENFNISFSKHLLNTNNEIKNNNNRKITKNDEYLFSLQMIKTYKNFIYEFLLTNIIKNVNK